MHGQTWGLQHQKSSSFTFYNQVSPFAKETVSSYKYECCLCTSFCPKCSLFKTYFKIKSQPKQWNDLILLTLHLFLFQEASWELIISVNNVLILRERLESHFYMHMPMCRMVVAHFQCICTFACLLSLVSIEEVLQLWREFVNATQPCHAQRNAAIPFLPPTASRLKETHF